jgi:hypothetical protein
MERSREVQVLPFTSRVRFVGRLVAAVRQAWYGVAARWQDMQISQQQSLFNHAVYHAMLGLQEVEDGLKVEVEGLRAEVEGLQREIEALHDLLYERGLETGILAEGLARLEMTAKVQDPS